MSGASISGVSTEGEGTIREPQPSQAAETVVMVSTHPPRGKGSSMKALW